MKLQKLVGTDMMYSKKVRYTIIFFLRQPAIGFHTKNAIMSVVLGVLKTVNNVKSKLIGLLKIICFSVHHLMASS